MKLQLRISNPWSKQGVKFKPGKRKLPFSPKHRLMRQKFGANQNRNLPHLPNCNQSKRRRKRERERERVQKWKKCEDYRKCCGRSRDFAEWERKQQERISLLNQIKAKQFERESASRCFYQKNVLPPHLGASPSRHVPKGEFVVVYGKYRGRRKRNKQG